MGFINIGKSSIRKVNSCASALVSLSDVRPPSVYKSHISNRPKTKLKHYIPSSEYRAYIKQTKVALSTVEKYRIFFNSDEYD